MDVTEYNDNIGVAVRIFHSTFPSTNTPLVVSTDPVIVHGYIIGSNFPPLSSVHAQKYNESNPDEGYVTVLFSAGGTAASSTKFLADGGLQLTHPATAAPSFGPNYEVTVFYSQVGR